MLDFLEEFIQGEILRVNLDLGIELLEYRLRQLTKRIADAIQLCWIHDQIDS